MCQVCRKQFENWSWPFSLISDGFLRPVILHVILPSSLAAGGRSLAVRLPAMFCKKWQHVHGQQLFHPSVLPRHVDRRSSHLLSHNRALLISVRKFVGGGVGGGVIAGKYGTVVIVVEFIATYRPVASLTSAVTQITSISLRIAPSRSLAVTFKISSASTPCIVPSLVATKTRHTVALGIWMAGWSARLPRFLPPYYPGRSKIAYICTQSRD